jgi:hypothetical protein
MVRKSDAVTDSLRFRVCLNVMLKVEGILRAVGFSCMIYGLGSLDAILEKSIVTLSCNGLTL